MKVQEILQDIMTEKKLSQEKMANILGVSQKTVSNWLCGNDTPKASSMLAIYEKFGVTPNELLGIEERSYKRK